MAKIIKMPRLSDTMEQGTLKEWNFKVGDKLKKGDLLASVETDKAVMDIECFDNGILLYAVDLGVINVNAIIAVIGKAGEVFDPSMLTDAPPPVAQDSPKTIEPAIIPEPSFVEDTTPEERLKASPLAKSIAKEAGVDLGVIKGSGEEGRIVKRDVEAAIQQKTSAPTPATVVAVPVANTVSSDDYTDIPVSGMRRVIAQRLGESKFSAPHFYLTMEINMDRAKAVREQLNGLSPVKLSFNDLVIKAVAMSLREHTGINASWLGDVIRINKNINMGVAVAIGDGLLVPVVRNADQKSLAQIAEEVKTLATKAKDRKISPAEMTGNTFTISNLGMFGIDEFTAIINPPDACILAVGAIIEKPIVVNGEIKAANMMKVTLSCDHRVVDGAMGAAFLQTLRAKLEEPMRLLV